MSSNGLATVRCSGSTDGERQPLADTGADRIDVLARTVDRKDTVAQVLVLWVMSRAQIAVFGMTERNCSMKVE